ASGGGVEIFTLSINDKPNPGSSGTGAMTVGGQNTALSVSRDGLVFTFANAGLQYPNEVRVYHEHALRQYPMISHANDKLLAELDLPRPESVTLVGAGRSAMQMWVITPPGFDPKKKWPLVYLVHGGPQGAWEDGWSYRWCPELWAAQGYVV